MGNVQALLLALSMCGLAWIALQDFLTLRIRNSHVLVLLAVALVAVLAGGEMADFLAGAILFALGVCFWLLGLVGAGDAKLYLPVGFLVGWHGLVVFGVLLISSSIAFLIFVWLGRKILRGQGGLGRRLDEIVNNRGVPYAVPIAAAAIGAMALRIV